MAGRTLNRRELRKQNDEAERAAPTPAAADPAEAPAGPKKKARIKTKTAEPKVKKPRKKKAPPRLCARWGVFDNSMKQVAIFDYNQRSAADQKVADLKAKKNAVYFLQVVKEPMPEPVAPETPLA